MNIKQLNHKIAKLVKEIQTQICIDDADVKIIEGLLKDELNEYYHIIDEYYEDEYYIAIEDVRTSAYDNGYADGYDAGYSESNSAVSF